MTKELAEESQTISVTHLETPDLAVVNKVLTMPGGNKIDMILCSAYFPGDESIKTTCDRVQKVINHCISNGIELLVGCDANAHHPYWGCDHEDSRGEYLANFLVENDLELLNEGNTPTFDGSRGSSIIDVTFCTPNVQRLITGWKVLNEDSFSDHKKITMKIAAKEVEPMKFRDKRSTNWNTVTALVRKKLENVDFLIENEHDLEDKSLQLNQVLLEAFHKGCKEKEKKFTKKLKWFNADLLNQRRNVRRCLNKARRFKTHELLETYRNEREKYKKSTESARRTSYRNTVTQIESLPEAARQQKFFEGNTKGKLSTIKKDNGEYTKNKEETLSALLVEGFKESTIIDKNKPQTDKLHKPTVKNRNDNDEIDICTTIDKIKWAIDSFSPFKSAGFDEIFPALLQKTKDIIAEPLQQLFRSSLRLNYIPESWRYSLVTFIPKQGKEDYSKSNAYRPISLMSFVLKTLEKLIDKRIRHVDLMKKPLISSQHAYQQGKSTESALHDLVTHVDKALASKSVNISVFIDISGAFDNTSANSIEQSAREKGIKEWVIEWTLELLRRRIVKTQSKHCQTEIIPTKGCPQGGCLSPLLWCLVLDPLLKDLNSMGYKVVAYADDLVLSITKKCAREACESLNVALRIVNNFCIQAGLHVNPTKTEMIRFTKNTKRNIEMSPVQLGEVELKLSKEVKYLGIYLDPTLSMNVHIENVYKKAMKSLWASKRMIGRTWGLHPYMARWVYKQIIVPRITYASIIFWKAAQKTDVIQKLAKIQRCAALIISGAAKSTPTVTMEAILNLTPIEIKIKATAIACFKRLKIAGTWIDNEAVSNHRSIKYLGEQLNLSEGSDKTEKFWNTEQKFATITEENQKPSHDGTKNVIESWTDASSNDKQIGVGLYCPALSIEQSLRLSDHGHITQAETVAISRMASVMIDKEAKNYHCIIYTDCLSAVKSLNRGLIDSKTTLTCIQELNRLTSLGNKVTVAWIKSHSGIKGNEIADKLAKKGRKNPSIDVTVHSPNKIWEENVENWIKNECGNKWESMKITHSKRMMTGFEDERLKKIRLNNRKELRVLIGILSGHCCLRENLRVMGKIEDGTCRFCNLEAEKMSHLLTDCPAMEIVQARKILSLSQHNAISLQQIEFPKLIEFAKETGIYETFFKFQEEI